MPQLTSYEDALCRIQQHQELEHLKKLQEQKRIEQRQKQIYYGVITTEYWNYQANHIGMEVCPLQTPSPYSSLTKRAFDTLVKAWRRNLHAWDNSPCPTGYDKTTEWNMRIFPTIKYARLFIAITTNDVDLSGLIFDVNKLTEKTNTDEVKCLINRNTFFSNDDDTELTYSYGNDLRC